MKRRHFVLAAGGTGGHMMPAHAVAAELARRGHKVALITDARGAKIPGLFEGAAVHVIPAGRLTGKPTSWVSGLRSITQGRAQAAALYRELQPAAVIGFGGYPAFPALAAALFSAVPTAVHEQNAVLGRVNRLLGAGVKAIATSYPQVQRVKQSWLDKVRLVGNPVRDEVLALREEPYPDLGDGLRVLVTGGSQGATILGRVVPEALGQLPEAVRATLKVTQQARAEDMEAVKARYAALGIPAEVQTYMTDLPARIARAHLVIARAGASTIAELTCAGRPAIFVPLAIATDDHQSYNVAEMVTAGAARSIPEAQFSAEWLAQELVAFGLDEQPLRTAAAAAKGCGRPNATRDLANLIEQLGRDELLPSEVGLEPAFA